MLAGADFFELDSELESEERLVRDNVRRLVSEEVLPSIDAHYQAGTFPSHLIGRFGEVGLLGANLEGYGCAGMGAQAYGLVMQELERGDSGIRSFCSVQGALCMFPIHRYGSEGQKKRWLPAMASGEVVGCFALTEPDFGSNPMGMLTTATRIKSGGYRLNGAKRWITNGNIAQLALVWAKLDGVIRGFLVPTETVGFRAEKMEQKFSLRASITSELVLEDVEVGPDALLEGVSGLKGPLSCLTEARAGIACGAVGAAVACYESALEYAKERVQFSRPIAGYQLVQDKLVYMVTEITKARLVARRVMELKAAGRLRPEQVSLAKRNNVEIALKSARLAREILGANGIMYDYPVARHLMNMETVYTYEGTHDIHTLIVGKAVTGLAAFD